MNASFYKRPRNHQAQIEGQLRVQLALIKLDRLRVHQCNEGLSGANSTARTYVLWLRRPLSQPQATAIHGCVGKEIISPAAEPVRCAGLPERVA